MQAQRALCPTPAPSPRHCCHGPRLAKLLPAPPLPPSLRAVLRCAAPNLAVGAAAAALPTGCARGTVPDLATCAAVATPPTGYAARCSANRAVAAALPTGCAPCVRGCAVTVSPSSPRRRRLPPRCPGRPSDEFCGISLLMGCAARAEPARAGSARCIAEQIPHYSLELTAPNAGSHQS
jgi:hypothetical protein